MIGRHARRRAIAVAVVVAAWALIAIYRRRALDRNAEAFHARYD